MRRSISFWRWSVIAFATIMWGFPLSVLSDVLGYGTIVGWMAGLIFVLLGDLFAFLWWSGVETEQRASQARRSAGLAHLAWRPSAEWRRGMRSYRE